jgi:hypothetical protein
MKKIDAHIHYVNFNQESQGFESLLRAMDVCEVEKAVIFGLPVKKKWAYHEEIKPAYYLDGYSTCYYYTLTDEFVAHHFSKLAPDDQSRFALLLCGFDPTDKSTPGYLDYMLDKYPFWKGLGELLLRHDELSLHTAGELPRVNHPALFNLYEYCEKYEFPVLFHHNAQSVGYEHKAVYVHEIREVIDQFPALQFVWAHAGASSRTVADRDYFNIIGDLLQRYPNLAVDISWKVYDQEILNDEQYPKQEYIHLIEQYPEKFMIGSDLTGKFEGELNNQMKKYDPLLDQLKKETAVKVARQNAERIYFRSI